MLNKISDSDSDSDSEIGCHVGKMYAGAFGYADDVVLLAPSLDVLREMVSICET